MFNRNPAPELPAEPPVEPDGPAADEETLPRWRRPSTFASRKAEGEQRAAAAGGKPNAQRLVSLGKSDHWQRDRHGKDHYTEVEQFYDIDHPMKRYVQFPGRPEFFPLFNTEGKRQTVTPIGTLWKHNARFQSAYPEPLPEPPPQRIE